MAKVIITLEDTGPIAVRVRIGGLEPINGEKPSKAQIIAARMLVSQKHRPGTTIKVKDFREGSGVLRA